MKVKFDVVLQYYNHDKQVFPRWCFCPRRTVFVGDYEVAVMCSLFVCLFVCLFKTLSYFWNQTSEFYETLLVLFIGQ